MTDLETREEEVPEAPPENPRAESRDELNAAAEANQAAIDTEAAEQLAEAHRINTEINQNPPMEAPPTRDAVRDELNAVTEENQDLNDQGHVDGIAEAQRAMEIFNPGSDVVMVPQAETRANLIAQAQANQDLNDAIHAQQEAEGNRVETFNQKQQEEHRKPLPMPTPKKDVRRDVPEMEKRKKKMDDKLAKKAGR